MKQENNKVVLLGKLVDNLKFSHSIKMPGFTRQRFAQSEKVECVTKYQLLYLTGLWR